MLNRLRLGLLALLACALVLPNAAATWSVVLMNRVTGEIVIACATCLPNTDLAAAVPVVRVGVGAAAAQSLVDHSGGNRQLIFGALEAGASPAEILAALEAGDTLHKTRQYGIVNRVDAPVKYTGQFAGAAKQAVAGEFGAEGEWVYAVQGNVLTSQAVVTAAVAALESTAGDGGQRVAAAMEAARALGGDGRCSCGAQDPTGCGAPPPAPFKSAHIGFFFVVRPGDTDGTCDGVAGCATGDYFFRSNIIGAGQDPDPVLQLADAYSAWRVGRSGKPDGLTSALALSAQRLPADGRTALEITVRLSDIDGVPLNGGGAALSVTSADGAPLLAAAGAPVDNLDGTYTIRLTAGLTSGSQQLVVRADDGGQPVTLSPYPVLQLDPVPPLHSGFDAVSSGAGAQVPITLNLTPDELYFVLASASGTDPGLSLPQGLIPLNLDGVLILSALQPNQVPFLNTFAAVDITGYGSASLELGSGLLGPLVGKRIDLSAVRFNFLSATPPDGFLVLP